MRKMAQDWFVWWADRGGLRDGLRAVVEIRHGRAVLRIVARHRVADWEIALQSGREAGHLLVSCSDSYSAVLACVAGLGVLGQFHLCIGSGHWRSVEFPV